MIAFTLSSAELHNVRAGKLMVQLRSVDCKEHVYRGSAAPRCKWPASTVVLCNQTQLKPVQVCAAAAAARCCPKLTWCARAQMPRMGPGYGYRVAKVRDRPLDMSSAVMQGQNKARVECPRPVGCVRAFSPVRRRRRRRRRPHHAARCAAELRLRPHGGAVPQAVHGGTGGEGHGHARPQRDSRAREGEAVV